MVVAIRVKHYYVYQAAVTPAASLLTGRAQFKHSKVWGLFGKALRALACTTNIPVSGRTLSKH